MAVGIKGFRFYRQVHTREARAGLDFLTTPVLLAVDQNIGVMHEALVAGSNLDGFEPAGAPDRRAKYKIPIIVRAARQQRIGFSSFHDGVRLAELPSFDKFELGR